MIPQKKARLAILAWLAMTLLIVITTYRISAWFLVLLIPWNLTMINVFEKIEKEIKKQKAGKKIDIE